MPKQTIKQSTPLIGSSILKNIKTKDLSDDVAVKTVPGATIEMFTSKLSEHDIELCITVIIHVGGNEADNGADLDTFRENFDTLINSVCDGTRRVIVSELLPRESVDLEPYIETLRSSCADNAVEFVENYNSFLLATGELPDTFFYKDKVHINALGTRRLLTNLDKLHQITRPFSVSVHKEYVSKNRPALRNKVITPHRGYRSQPKFCHICHRNGGHGTQECWYNGRSNKLMNRVSR